MAQSRSNAQSDGKPKRISTETIETRRKSGGFFDKKINKKPRIDSKGETD